MLVEAALSTIMDGSLTRAAEFIGQFAPVLYVVGGLALAMWVLSYLRGFFGA